MSNLLEIASGGIVIQANNPAQFHFGIVISSMGRKHPILIINSESIDRDSPSWRSQLVHRLVECYLKSRTCLKESEIRFISDDRAILFLDGKEIAPLRDFPEWRDFREMVQTTFKEELAAFEKSKRFHHSLVNISPADWVCRDGKSTAGKGIDFSKLSMAEVAIFAQKRKQAREAEKFSGINKKLFR